MAPLPADTPRAPAPLSRDDQTALSLAALGLPREALPRHIAVIMDGNGRWAQQRGEERIVGHAHGAASVRDIVTECARLRLEALTLYSFSLENWKRPQREVGFLMDLYVQYLAAERPTMMDNDVRFVQIGRREGLSEPLLAELDLTTRMTADNRGLVLALALNYGSRAEITDAARALARKACEGLIQPQDITEDLFAQHLYTAQLPDPDLLIRTAGEMRLSNYLLWQISYAEIYVASVCWPDFTVDELRLALRAYAQRQRRFGAVPGLSPDPA